MTSCNGGVLLERLRYLVKTFQLTWLPGILLKVILTIRYICACVWDDFSETPFVIVSRRKVVRSCFCCMSCQEL